MVIHVSCLPSPLTGIASVTQQQQQQLPCSVGVTVSQSLLARMAYMNLSPLGCHATNACLPNWHQDAILQ